MIVSLLSCYDLRTDGSKVTLLHVHFEEVLGSNIDHSRLGMLVGDVDAACSMLSLG